MTVIQLAKIQEFANSLDQSVYSLLAKELLAFAESNSEEAYVTDSLIAEVVNSHEDVASSQVERAIELLSNIDFEWELQKELEFQLEEENLDEDEED